MIKTAVVILNWNGKSLLEQFLPTLVAYTPSGKAEIIVADNGSTDDSLRFLEKNYPTIRCIILDKNYGFAEGYNRALAQLDNEYVVLLNSDVEVSPDWLITVVNYLDEHSDVVAVQPKLLAQKDKTSFEYAGAAGGYMDMFGYPYCRGRVFTVVEKDHGQYDEPAEILWASGACLFIRLKEYKEAGGLDAYFFAHQEEIDLCWRLTSRGKRIICLPASVVYHVGGATLSMENPRKTFLNFRNNLLMIYKNMPEKYYQPIMVVRFFLDYLAALQFLLKGHPANAHSVWKARHDFRKQKKNYKEIRRKNLSIISPELPKGFLHKSLVWNFYLQNKKTFKAINP